MGFLDQPVSLYRFHGSQMTRDPDRLRKASFAMLDKIFNDPTLPEKWRAMRTQAYCSAHLRAAAQAYRAGALESAKNDLREAVNLDLELCSDGAEQLVESMFAWADDPRTGEPLEFLERIFESLPESLIALCQRREQVLARGAVRYAFDAFLRDDLRKTRYYLFHAIRYQPKWLINRGVLSIFSQSLASAFRIR
jgi:hypothetical protein